MSGFLRVLRDLALLLSRIGLGGILIMHGWRRWQEQGINSQVAYLQQFGTPFPTYAAWGATILELVGGLFLIVGALTPLVAAAVVAEQVLIIAYTNWYKGLALTNLEGQWTGGYEYNIILGLLALLLTVYGSGRIGVDRLFRRNKPDDDDLDDDPTPPGRDNRDRTNRDSHDDTARL
jgi:putative oxidoreductase